MTLEDTMQRNNKHAHLIVSAQCIRLQSDILITLCLQYLIMTIDDSSIVALTITGIQPFDPIPIH